MSAKNKYTSKGERRNVSSKILNALAKEYKASGERKLNQLKAYRASKNVMITIENPNKLETNKKFIRVKASSVWKPYDKQNDYVMQ